MCAINGITREDTDLVKAMNVRTQHRGPDGSQVWVGKGITLGHNRLAIIDLSDAALQPMKSTDGRYTIVFNGEIYNYRELRKELEGKYDFRTKSDTEVLLAAYAHWGEAMFPRLRGIFAFGIWDANEESLLLVRDHMGVKPLYYRFEEGTLTFSSELPPLLIGRDTNRIDPESLAFYLSMEYVPASRTLIEGVQKLPAGTLLRYKAGKIDTASYLEHVPQKRMVSPTELYTAIDTAVERQLVSDRPLGAYLSGGFDSSIVVHHMVKHEALTKTYSAAFEAVKGQEADTEKFNADSLLAQKTAAFYGTEHKTLTITLDMVRATIEKATSTVSEPVANSTAVTQYLLSDFVRQDGTVVVLGGDGGDELFGGYTRHRIAMAAYLYQQLPSFMQRLGGFVSPRIGKLSTPFGTPLHRTLMVKSEKKIAPFLTSSLDIDETVKAFFDEEYRNILQEQHPMDAFMQVDRHTWLPDECFLRSDYASMAHGIELRVPFVDIDVVALSDMISPRKKTWPREGKRIIRKTYRSHLPPHLYGQPKRGWLSPAAKWFRDPVINSFVKNVFSSEYYNGLDGVFDWNKVQALLDDHVEKRGYYLYPLWNILVLQMWAQNNKVVFEVK